MGRKRYSDEVFELATELKGCALAGTAGDFDFYLAEETGLQPLRREERLAIAGLMHEQRSQGRSDEEIGAAVLQQFGHLHQSLQSTDEASLELATGDAQDAPVASLAAASHPIIPAGLKATVAGEQLDIYRYGEEFWAVFSNPDPLQKHKQSDDVHYRYPYGLYEEPLDKDGHLHGIVEQRCNAVLSAPRSLNPANSSPEAQLVAAVVERVLSDIDGFESDLRDLWFAVWYGAAYVEPIYRWDDQFVEETEAFDGDGSRLGTQRFARPAIVVQELRNRHPRRFVFTTVEHELRLLTPQAAFEGVALPPRKMLHFAPYRRFEDPYGIPLARSCWWWWFFKKQGIKWWNVFIEKFASPTVVATHPATATTDEKASYRRVATSVGTNQAVTIPEGVVLELMEAQRSGTVSCYLDLCEFCDRQMTKAVLGQTLTTEQGSSGARSMAEVHLEVRQGIIRADANALQEFFNRDLIRWIVDLNFEPSMRHYPKLEIDTDPPADATANLDRFIKFNRELRQPIRRSQAYRDSQIEPPQGDDDDIIEPPELPAPLQPENDNENPKDKPGDGKGGAAPSEDEQAEAAEADEADAAASPQLVFAGFSHEPLLLQCARLQPLEPGLAASADREMHKLALANRELMPSRAMQRLYSEGVKAQAAGLVDLPGAAAANFAKLARERLQDYKPELPLTDNVASQLAGFMQELDLEAWRLPFIDRLNDDITSAALISHRDFFSQAGDELLGSSPALELAKANPTFGNDRIIPDRVLRLFTGKVARSLGYAEFYQLDAIGRATAFTAWDLAAGDIRSLGTALNQAIEWGYTVQEFEDYLFERIKARYVIQGEELHAWHVETIYHTNLATAYNHAQADSIWDRQQTFPYFQIVNPDPEFPRCVESAGKVWPTSQLGEIGVPPWHFNCGTTLRSLTQKTLERRGLLPELQPPANDPALYQGPRDPSTGQRIGSPQPFGGWAPREQRLASVDEQIQRIRSEN